MNKGKILKFVTIKGEVNGDTPLSKPTGKLDISRLNPGDDDLCFFFFDY